MAKSFVNIGRKGFWASDAILEIVAGLLAQQLEQLNSNGNLEWLNTYNSHLSKIRDGNFSGFINFRFDEIPTTAKDSEVFMEALKKVLEHLTKYGKKIPKESLNTFFEPSNNSRKWGGDLDVDTVIDVINKIKVILDSRERDSRI